MLREVRTAGGVLLIKAQGESLRRLRFSSEQGAMALTACVGGEGTLWL
jgi:hypothetical protein